MVSRKPLRCKKCISDSHSSQLDMGHKSVKNCRDLRGWQMRWRRVATIIPDKTNLINTSHKEHVPGSRDWDSYDISAVSQFVDKNCRHIVITIRSHDLIFILKTRVFHVHHLSRANFFQPKKLQTNLVLCKKSLRAKRVIIRLLRILLGDDEVLVFIASWW